MGVLEIGSWPYDYIDRMSRPQILAEMVETAVRICREKTRPPHQAHLSIYAICKTLRDIGNCLRDFVLKPDK